jgi:hypothetical protein
MNWKNFSIVCGGVSKISASTEDGMIPHEHFVETIGGLRCKVLVLVPQKMRNLMCKAPLFLSNESEHYLYKGKNLLVLYTGLFWEFGSSHT